MRPLIALTFLLLTAWFARGSEPVLPTTPRALVEASQIERDAVREVMTDPATTRIAGLEMTCESCHSLFPSPVFGRVDRRQHLDLVLEHGLNDRCENCHSTRDESQLVLYGGIEVPYAKVEELCAKCHGPTFRDWEQGIHGKSEGSWDPAAPEHRRMRCTECHDPHRPAFGVMTPLPPPRTLRMRATEARVDGGARRKRNPLRDSRDESAPGEHRGAGHE